MARQLATPSDHVTLLLPSDVGDIASLAWSPADFKYDQEYLMASTWDNRVLGYRIYDSFSSLYAAAPVPAALGNATIAAPPAAAAQQAAGGGGDTSAAAVSRLFAEPRLDIRPHDAPILSCDITRDADLITGSCDNTLKSTSLERIDTSILLGIHKEPVNKVKSIAELGDSVLSSSWDGTCCIWDARVQRNAEKPLIRLEFAGSIIDFDLKFPVLAVASNLKDVHVFDLRRAFGSLEGNSNFGFVRKFSNILKSNSTCISLFNDRQGFILGSIEGRCAVHHIAREHASCNFAFKCHRDNTTRKIYSVASIDMHPIHGTFTTTGSDGKLYIWDKNSRQRLYHEAINNEVPIRTGRFNATGKLLAYACCYDFSRGPTSDQYEKRVQICVRRIRKAEVRARAPPPYNLAQTRPTAQG